MGRHYERQCGRVIASQKLWRDDGETIFATRHLDISTNQGGSGTEPERGTGTAGTVFPGTDLEEPEPPQPFFGNRNRNRNRRSLLNSTETQEKDLRKGTARTENRNRSNRSKFQPQTVTEPNRGHPDKRNKHSGFRGCKMALGVELALKVIINIDYRHPVLTLYGYGKILTEGISLIL